MARKVKGQVDRNFKTSKRLKKGVKMYGRYDEDETVASVRLSPILSGHAEKRIISGNPSIWILLPDGERLGFKRMSSGGWDKFQSRYRDRLFYQKVADGTVIVYRHSNGSNYAIYKIQSAVMTRQRLDLGAASRNVNRVFEADLLE